MRAFRFNQNACNAASIAERHTAVRTGSGMNRQLIARPENDVSGQVETADSVCKLLFHTLLPLRTSRLRGTLSCKPRLGCLVPCLDKSLQYTP